MPIFTNYPFSGWAPIFEKETEFNLTRNALLTTVATLPHEWVVEFLFKRTNSSINEWTSIFHMTVGGDRSTIGDRTPAVFFNPIFGFQIATACNNSDNFNKDFPAPPIDVDGQRSEFPRSSSMGSSSTGFSSMDQRSSMLGT